VVKWVLEDRLSSCQLCWIASGWIMVYAFWNFQTFKWIYSIIFSVLFFLINIIFFTHGIV